MSMSVNVHGHANEQQQPQLQLQLQPIEPNNNEVTNIDEVTDEPGSNYENWIKISRRTLRARESKLMMQREKTFLRIVRNQIKLFETMHSSDHTLVAPLDDTQFDVVRVNCINKLNLLLSHWNGINICKTRRKLNTFRKYYGIVKCWFDQKKKAVLAPELWIASFDLLEKFVIEYATQCYDDKHIEDLFAKYLFLLIIAGVFQGQLHCTATKPQPLIQSSMVKDNQPMKHWLTTLSPTLTVQYLMKHYYQTAKNKLHAKELLEVTNRQLNKLRKEAKFTFMAATTDTSKWSNNQQYKPHQCGMGNFDFTFDTDINMETDFMPQIMEPTFDASEFEQNEPSSIMLPQLQYHTNSSNMNGHLNGLYVPPPIMTCSANNNFNQMPYNRPYGYSPIHEQIPHHQYPSYPTHSADTQHCNQSYQHTNYSIPSTINCSNEYVHYPPAQRGYIQPHQLQQQLYQQQLVTPHVNPHVCHQIVHQNMDNHQFDNQQQQQQQFVNDDVPNNMNGYDNQQQQQQQTTSYDQQIYNTNVRPLQPSSNNNVQYQHQKGSCRRSASSATSSTTRSSSATSFSY